MKMSHPDSKKSIDVRDDQLALYASAGWEPASHAAKKALAESE